MKTFPMLVIALGLAVGGCKKEKKDDGGGGAAGSGEVKKDPAGGSGEASGTGSAMASGTDTGSGSGMASGTETGSGSGSGTGTGSGTGSAVDVEATGDGVKLVLATPAVGETVNKNGLKVTDAMLTIKGKGQMPMHVEEVEVVHAKYLEVGEFPTKVEVNYEDNHKTTTMQGKEKSEDSPVKNKTYTVWKDGEKIAASNNDGSAVTPEELEELDSWQDEIGQVPGIAKVLAAHAWKAGEVYTLTPDELTLMEDGKEGGKILSATLTLESESGGNAIFLSDMKTEMNNAQLVGKLDTHLTVTVQLSPARPLSVVSETKIDATAGGIPFVGTMNGTDTYTY